MNPTDPRRGTPLARRGCQRFCLAFVLLGTGGENWRRGQNRTIQWTSSGVAGNVRIDLARDGTNYTERLAGSTVNDSVDRWTVTGPPTNSARIRFCTVDLSVSDAGDGVFRVR